MIETADKTALVLAVMLKRSGKARARISEKTLRLISRRTSLRDAFVVAVEDVLDGLDIIMVRIPRGGFVLISKASLEGAPPLTVKGNPDVPKLSQDQLESELGLTDPDDDE